MATASVSSALRRQPSSLASMPSTHFSANRRLLAVSSWIDSSRLRAISGTRTLSSKFPCEPATVIAVSLPMTCAATCMHDLGDDRVDLPRHDRGALLQLGQAAARRCRRAGRSPSSPGRWRSWSRETARPSARPTARRGRRGFPGPRTGPRAGGCRDRSAPPAASRTRSANSGCVLRPVPVAVPPSGICATCGSALRTRSRAEADLRGVAGELLAERDRHGVHQVRAPRLDDVLELLGLVRERLLQPLQRRQQAVRGLVERGQVHGAGEDVVRRLPHVHVVVGMDALAGEVGDDLVGVRVRGRARAGLEGVDGELVVELARPPRGRRPGRSARATSASSSPSSPLARAAARLDATEPVDRPRASPGPGDGEVVDGLVGLAAAELLAISCTLIAPTRYLRSRSCTSSRASADRVVVGHQEAGARQHPQLAVGQPAQGLLGRLERVVAVVAGPEEQDRRGEALGRRRGSRGCASTRPAAGELGPRARAVAVPADVGERVADEVARRRIAAGRELGAELGAEQRPVRRGT